MAAPDNGRLPRQPSLTPLPLRRTSRSPLATSHTHADDVQAENEQHDAHAYASDSDGESPVTAASQPRSPPPQSAPPKHLPFVPPPPRSGDRRTSHAAANQPARWSTHGDELIPSKADPMRSASTSAASGVGASAQKGVRPMASSGSMQHRVRFSSDVDRPQVASIPIRPLAPSPAIGPSRNPSGTSAGPSLRIDTDHAAYAGDGVGRSSGEISPGSIIASPPPPNPGGLVAPSPSTRQRGYSLRRTVFAKNIQRQAGDGEIELEGGDHGLQDGFALEQDERPGPESEGLVDVHDDHEDAEDVTDPAEALKGRKHWSWSSANETWRKRRGFGTAFHNWLQKFNDGFRRHVLRMKPIPPSKDGRHIEMDVWREQPLIDGRTGKPYAKNTIRSSRYTLWSFFPRQLFAQFSKLANFYFLLVAVLQMIPGLSTTGSYTTIIPLMFFVCVSMAKEGFDDLRRYRMDKEENARIGYVLHPQADNSASAASESLMADASRYWKPTKWINIKVGDVLRLDRDQIIPADVILLSANDPNGIAYIETMALDGETNLKSKQPCVPMAQACARPEDIVRNKGIRFVAEDPNLDLYKFEGNVTVGDQTLPLTNNEVVYRGSIMRNTPEAYGLVCYTGEECKVRMNANKNPRIKAPALQSQVNRVVAVIAVFIVILAAACTIAYYFWDKDIGLKSWYLTKANVPIGPVFTSFIIMFNTMVPISLYVSLEIVKVAQVLLMNDIDMYDEETDTPIHTHTSTINEELGQVSYIFSDKTGTLTNNTMRFRKMSVAGTAWLHDTDLQDEDDGGNMLMHKKRQQSKGKKPVSRKSTALPDEDAVALNRPSASVRRWKSNRRNRMYHGGNTSDMLQYIRNRPNTVFANKTRLFLLAMSLCHTCFPDRDEHGNVSYQAASPDESALVLAAKELGYTVVDRQPNTLTVQRRGTNNEPIEEVFEILDVIEFSSARKRMSIVIRMPNGRICVFCKGADTVITKLLKRATIAQNKAATVERRASRRKSLEAKEIIRRHSTHVGRSSSAAAAIPAPRPSFASARRSSVNFKRQSLVKESIDFWLRDRETDGGLELQEEDLDSYSPRPSAQVGRQRGSIYSTHSDGHRQSFQALQGDEEEGLVDEELVVNDNLVMERCFQHLNDFATEGLRTLLYAYRYMDESEYREWKQAFHEASTSLIDRQERMEKLGEQIETQLEMVGATAIEDKLQKGVPEAIEKLRRANIRMWMLTGDKRETAINIGHSCRLVKDYSTVTILNHESRKLEQTIIATSKSIKAGEVAHSVIVIDGQTLSVIESDVIVSERFFDLTILADSVICCRASPKQKAFLVRSIRKRVKKSVTLAIGDGANDIAMIQEAHVGIGVAGKEGMQAARISDYSIAQFRFLLKLLLVHGRWNYIRVCRYTLGTFWKETLFYLTQALYQKWNGYTGTSMYESTSLSMFNTLFTSLPVIFMGVFEKDLAASTLLAVPELYNKGQRHLGFNIRLYLGWAFMAVCDAMIIYFLMFVVWALPELNEDQGIFPMGLLCFSSCITVISIKLQFLEIHNRSIMAALSMFLSVGGWWLWNLILSAIYPIKPIYNVRYNLTQYTGRNLLWWTALLVSIVAVVVWEILVATLRNTFFPTDVDFFQEYEQDPAVKRRFEEAAASELQAGWNRGSKKSSFELARELEEQAERELQVQRLLDRRSAGTDVEIATHDPDVTLVSQTHSQTQPTEKKAHISVHEHHPHFADSHSHLSGTTATNSDSANGSGSDDNNGDAVIMMSNIPLHEAEAAAVGATSPRSRRSVDVHDMIRRGFGSVRRGQLG